MKIYISIILVVIVVIAALVAAYPYFIKWYLNGVFEPAMAEGGGIQKLADAMEASIGSTLARGDARLQPGGSAGGEGILSYYEKNPQALQRDKKYFQTWFSAMNIAEASGKLAHRPGRWANSAEVDWVAPSHRTDAWGHAFCIQSDQQKTIVVSPGPQALSSLNCNTLKIPKEDLARMPRGRLNPLPSGALILFVNK
jgi:hypothetical protein